MKVKNTQIGHFKITNKQYQKQQFVQWFKRMQALAIVTEISKSKASQIKLI